MRSSEIYSLIGDSRVPLKTFGPSSQELSCSIVFSAHFLGSFLKKLFLFIHSLIQSLNYHEIQNDVY